MQEFDVSTIVFALLAAFVVWKLRSVLGERSGEDPQVGDRPRTSRTLSEQAANANGPDERQPSPTALVRTEDLGGGDPALTAALDKMAALDPAFVPSQFLEGAKAAYEMIISAFAAADRATLKGLLSKEVFESFNTAIAEREANGLTVQTTFVSIDKTRITEAHLRGRTAHVTVRFESKLITATKNRDGEVVDGDADKVSDVIDIWTFARELGSRDPNWRLAATEAVS